MGPKIRCNAHLPKNDLSSDDFGTLLFEIIIQGRITQEWAEKQN
jgi:hypothetical protein